MATILFIITRATIIMPSPPLPQGEAYCGTFHPDHEECSEVNQIVIKTVKKMWNIKTRKLPITITWCLLFDR